MSAPHNDSESTQSETESHSPPHSPPPPSLRNPAPELPHPLPPAIPAPSPAPVLRGWSARPAQTLCCPDAKNTHARKCSSIAAQPWHKTVRKSLPAPPHPPRP